MFRFKVSLSAVKLSALNYSLLKFRLGNLGQAFQDLVFTAGSQQKRHHPPTFYSTFSMGEVQKTLIKCPFRQLQSISRHSAEKCLCKLSPPQPLRRSILLHSRYLGLPPERFQTLLQKDNLPRPVLFLTGRGRQSCKTNLQQGKYFRGKKDMQNTNANSHITVVRMRTRN